MSKLNAKHCNITSTKADCLIVGIFDDKILSGLVKQLDKTSKGFFTKLIKSGDLNGELGKILILHNIPNIKASRILLVGLGKVNQFNQDNLITACNNAFAELKKTPSTSIICALSDIDTKKIELNVIITQAVISFYSSQYDFNHYKSSKSKTTNIKELSFSITKKTDEKIINSAIKTATAIAIGMNYTKDLGNTPANVCTPNYLANEAKKLAKKYAKFTTKNLNEAAMRKLKMGSLLAVAQGSNNPAYLITMEYKGGKAKDAPIVFVGKGITFDTGGNSLKPPANMIGMKYDMCGAATVFGIMKFCAEYKLPLNIIGVVAAAENMPGPKAIRPDDIITSMSGKTIEVLNTDAEGRLVLADALTYSERYKPKAVIDIATLTGACVVALGRHRTAVYSNDDKLSKKLNAASENISDKAWPMPLGEEYKAQLSSNFADYSNLGGGEAGSVTAACFLSIFTEKYNWAHLDVAGTACRFTGSDKQATGRPVPMLAQYLLNEIK